MKLLRRYCWHPWMGEVGGHGRWFGWLRFRSSPVWWATSAAAKAGWCNINIPKRTQPNLGLRPSASFCSFFLAKPDSPESPLVERQRHKDMNIAMDDVPMMGFVRRRIAERRAFMSPALYVYQSQSCARICGPTAVVLSNDPWGREHWTGIGWAKARWIGTAGK